MVFVTAIVTVMVILLINSNRRVKEAMKFKNINKEFQIKALSKKEYEILKHIAYGKMDKEIAQKLHISISTVRSHISNIFEKLELNTRTQLVTYFLNEKIKYILKVKERLNEI